MRCASRIWGVCQLALLAKLGRRRPPANVRKLGAGVSELSQRSVQNVLAAYRAFSNTANAASSQPHGDPRPREMSGNVSVGVMLTVERVFDAATGERCSSLRLPRQSQKRLPSVSTYARARRRARRVPNSFNQYRCARHFDRFCARRSGYAHTPPEPQTHIGPRRRARASKELRARRDRGAQRPAHSNPQKQL